MLKDKKTAIALVKFLIFPILCLVFCFKLFNNIEYWGVGDWDQHFFLSRVPDNCDQKIWPIAAMESMVYGGNGIISKFSGNFSDPLHFALIFFRHSRNHKSEYLVALCDCTVRHAYGCESSVSYSKRFFVDYRYIHFCV